MINDQTRDAAQAAGGDPVTTTWKTLREEALDAHRELRLAEEQAEASQRAQADQQAGDRLRELVVSAFADFIPGGVDSLSVIWADDPEHARPWRPFVVIDGITFEANPGSYNGLVASLARPGCGHRMSGKIEPRRRLADLGKLLARLNAEEECGHCKYEAEEGAAVGTPIPPSGVPATAEDHLVAALRAFIASELAPHE